MTVRITTRDTGHKALLKRIGGPLTVTTGIHAAEGAAAEDGSDLTVADIAGIHEFGTGVPERSWLRDFVDENRTRLLDMLALVAVEIVAGANPDREMERFGLLVVGMIKQRIVAGIDPELTEATKREKQRITGGGAKDIPLIRFGQLISSITHEVVK